MNRQSPWVSTRGSAPMRRPRPVHEASRGGAVRWSSWYTPFMPDYVALLRGINVGGKNLIKMPALKACFEASAFEDVVAYIQSGNVLFASPETRGAELTARIEARLAETFGYQASVVVSNRKQLRAVVERAPEAFGAEPMRYRSDVIFLKEPLTAKVAMKSVSTTSAVDEAHAGTGVLYFSR